MAIVMIKNTIFLSALVIWATFVGAADVRAAEYYFVTLEYPPLEFSNKAGAASGAAVEIVTRIMNRLNHSVSIEVLPWTRAVKMVQFGRADAIFTIFKNPERQLFLNYSTEILIPQPVAFYAKKESAISYEGNPLNLKHLKVGVVSTISYGRKFDSTRGLMTVERTATLEQNFAKLMLGRIDLVISNVYSAEIVINRMRIADAVKQLEPYVESVPSYIAFAKVKDTGSLLADFDRELAKLKKSGDYDRIIKKWGVVIPNP